MAIDELETHHETVTMDRLSSPASRSESTSRSSRRRARAIVAVLASVALVVPFAGAAQATSSVARVTGTYTYFAYDDPNEPRTVSISVQATDPVKGSFTWTRPAGDYSGPVTCVRVVGNDAWFAGPVTKEPKRGSEGFNSVFFYVHDGGTPGSAGDLSFVWGALSDETLGDMEALCASMDTGFYGSWAFTVVAGNVTVRPAR
ncbi:MAG: hypothetical protein M3P18_07480 [Actinomycetota bacterium]|nr:hypothetical protein [Actinomycetota bacterium]